MKRNTALKILNPVLFLFFVNQAVTILFHTKMPREIFKTFHKGGGKILLGLIIIHFILNFNWIKANYFSKK